MQSTALHPNRIALKLLHNLNTVIFLVPRINFRSLQKSPQICACPPQNSNAAFIHPENAAAQPVSTWTQKQTPFFKSTQYLPWLIWHSSSIPIIPLEYRNTQICFKLIPFILGWGKSSCGFAGKYIFTYLFLMFLGSFESSFSCASIDIWYIFKERVDTSV